MAAPSYVNAGTGATDAGGAWSYTCQASAAAGRVFIVQILQDGTTTGAVTSVVGTNIENLGGTDNVWTAVAVNQAVGSSTAALQHIYIGRALSTSAPTISGANSTSEDLYIRSYQFTDVSTGTTLATVIENGTAGATANGVATSNTAADTGVTTLGVDRLALNLVGVGDDNGIATFSSFSEAWSGSGSPTVVFQCGAECAAVTAHWTAVTGPAGDSTTQKRSGARALIVAAAGAAANLRITGASSNHYVIRLAIYLNGLPTADAEFASLRASGPNNAILGFDNATDKLCVFEQGGWANRVLGPVLVTGTWTVVDLHVDGTIASKAPTISWQVDGEAQTTLSGTSAVGSWDTGFYVGQATVSGHLADTTYTAYFDDVVISNTAGDYPILDGTVPAVPQWAAETSYAESSGTDGAIRLQYATMASAGTINGGTASITDSDAWGVVGFALIGTTVVTTITPAAAAIAIAGATPTVTVAGGNTVVQPGAAAVSIAGATPTIVAQNWPKAVPAAVAIGIAGATPAVATPVGIAPAAAAITIGTATPTIVAQNWPLAQPAAAAITVGTATPTVVAQNYILLQPAAVAITIGTATPEIGTPVSIAPSAAEVAIAGATPAVLFPIVVAPVAAAVSIAGVAPVVATHVLIQPAAAAVTIDTATPAVSATQTYTPAAVAVTVDTATPAISATQTYTPAAVDITVAGDTPAVTTDVLVAPSAAEVAIAGATPNVVGENYVLVQPEAAAVSIAGATPAISVSANVQVQPDAAAIAIAGDSCRSGAGLSPSPARRGRGSDSGCHPGDRGPGLPAGPTGGSSYRHCELYAGRSRESQPGRSSHRHRWCYTRRQRHHRNSHPARSGRRHGGDGDARYCGHPDIPPRCSSHRHRWCYTRRRPASVGRARSGGHHHRHRHSCGRRQPARPARCRRHHDRHGYPGARCPGLPARAACRGRNHGGDRDSGHFGHADVHPGCGCHCRRGRDPGCSPRLRPGRCRCLRGRGGPECQPDHRHRHSA